MGRDLLEIATLALMCVALALIVLGIITWLG